MGGKSDKFEISFLARRPTPRVAELKVIGAGKTLFPRGDKGKGAERRASKLTQEYESSLRRYDVRFHGAAPMVRGQPEPVPGPLLARFRSYGGLCKKRKNKI